VTEQGCDPVGGVTDGGEQGLARPDEQLDIFFFIIALGPCQQYGRPRPIPFELGLLVEDDVADLLSRTSDGRRSEETATQFWLDKCRL